MAHRFQITQQAARRFSFIFIALTAMALPAAAEMLSGPQLKSFISGRRIFISVPLGGEIPLTYRSNGVVDGSGEAAGLGKYMTPKDKGRWWVSGEKLCQRWQQWYDGRTFCFTVTKLSGNRLRWVRDDGNSGVARVQ